MQGPVRPNGAYDILVGRPDLAESLKLPLPVEFADATTPAEAVLFAAEARLDPEARALNGRRGEALGLGVLAFTAAQESCFVHPDRGELRQVVQRYITPSRRHFEDVIRRTRQQLAAGGVMSAPALAYLLNTMHPDYTKDPRIGLVTPNAVYVGDYQRPLSRKGSREVYNQVIASNLDATVGHLRTWRVTDGIVPLEDAAAMAVTLEARLWQGWSGLYTESTLVTPDVLRARAQRMVSSFGAVGGLLVRRRLPREIHEAYEAAKDVLGRP